MKHACAPRRTVRRITRHAAHRITRRAALAALLGCAPALAACKGPGGSGAAGTASPTSMPPPAVGSMVPQVTELALDAAQSDRNGEGWQTTLTSERAGTARLDILPTRAGPLVCLLPYYFNNGSDAALVALDPADGSPAWARLVSLPGGAAPRWEDYESAAGNAVTEAAHRSDVVVSPDGRYVSVILRAYVSPTLSEHVSAVAILDPASGRTVRTEEIRGLVLGQALTDDALVIQTSSLLHPGSETVIAGPDGPGAGDVVDTSSTLTAFPLTDPQAPPTTGSTPLWLLGATRDSLLLGASRIDPACPKGNCLGYRVALATASGRATGQIDGVYAVHPNSLLERFTGGQTDDAALTAMARNAPASTADQDEESNWNQVWAGLGRELLDPASGATADITSFTLSDAPTTSRWITIRQRPAWSEGNKGPTFTPETAGWMDAPGPVSTEPIMMLSHGGPQKDSSTFTVSLTRTPFTGRTG